MIEAKLSKAIIDLVENHQIQNEMDPGQVGAALGAALAFIASVAHATDKADVLLLSFHATLGQTLKSNLCKTSGTKVVKLSDVK